MRHDLTNRSDREALDGAAADQLALVDLAIDSMRAALADLERARALLAGKRIEVEPELPDSQDDDLLELGEAARRFRIAKDTLRSWARRENIGVKKGGRWLVSIRQLRAKFSEI